MAPIVDALDVATGLVMAIDGLIDIDMELDPMSMAAEVFEEADD